MADIRAAGTADALQAAIGYGAVAVRLADPLKLALAVIALDGQVERLLLLSSDMSDAEARDLLAQFGGDALLTDTLSESGRDGPEIIWRKTPKPGKGADTPPTSRVTTEWIFATSGTTGTPKLVAHSLASLTRTTKLFTGAPRRWGQMYNIARFAGIQVFLQGLTGGSLLLPTADTGLPEQLVFLAAKGCTALSATPTLWRKILMTPGHEVLPLEQVTLGGEIADGAILSALTRTYPAARVVHIYASTEAGAAFSVRDGRPGFPVSYLHDAPGGVRLKVVDGRLFVRTRSTRATYLNRQEAFADAEGFVDTGDRVEIDGDRCLFLGRENGAINVGGNKVYPEEVEHVLLAHPAVDLRAGFGAQKPDHRPACRRRGRGGAGRRSGRLAGGAQNLVRGPSAALETASHDPCGGATGGFSRRQDRSGADLIYSAISECGDRYLLTIWSSCKGVKGLEI
ncbi:MAG: AMP-binding protein [Asticcacaulis sp.]|nr:AMP-binding protein [Asticcacaulis sp.]